MGYADDFERNCLTKLFPSYSPSQNITRSSSPTFVSRGTGRFSFEFPTDDLFVLEPKFKPEGKSFVHFTSLKGLFGILNSLKLRAYSLNNANDPNEFQLMNRIFDFELEGLKKNIFCTSFIDSSVLDDNADNLLHWRLYGDSGHGAFIEFEIDRPTGSFKDWIFANVIYDINKSLQKIDEFKTAVNEFAIKHQLEVPKETLSTVAKYYCGLHKSDHFSYEKESRMLYFSDEISSFNGYLHEISIDISRYNDIVYYKEIDIDPKNNPKLKIKSIQLGFKNSDEFVSKLNESINTYYLYNFDLNISVAKSPLGNILK